MKTKPCDYPDTIIEDVSDYDLHDIELTQANLEVAGYTTAVHYKHGTAHLLAVRMQIEEIVE